MERNLRKTRIGKVVSNKMDKTIVVAAVSYTHLCRTKYFKSAKRRGLFLWLIRRSESALSLTITS